MGGELLAVRANVMVGLLHPYFFAASTDNAFQVWNRVVGVEREFLFGPMPMQRLPQMRIHAGVGYLLDEPHEGKVRGYLSVGYRP